MVSSHAVQLASRTDTAIVGTWSARMAASTTDVVAVRAGHHEPWHAVRGAVWASLDFHLYGVLLSGSAHAAILAATKRHRRARDERVAWWQIRKTRVAQARDS